MCDPLTAVLGALGGAASLFGGKDTPEPPPAKAPALAPPDARDPGAKVLVGDGASSNSNSSTPRFDGFTNKRTTGKSLGGLGRGGLGL